MFDILRLAFFVFWVGITATDSLCKFFERAVFSRSPAAPVAHENEEPRFEVEQYSPSW